MSPQTQQMIMGLLMWVVVFGVFYFLLIRPQKKKDKELKEMREKFPELYKQVDRLNKLIERSNILVIASHSRQLIEKCCTRVLWLEHGQLKMDGKPEVVCPLYFR